MEADPFLEMLLLCAAFPAAHAVGEIDSTAIAELFHCLKDA